MFLVDEVQTLTSLGLTYWQAKVYSALVQMGLMTVKTISRVSGIPRQHIYKVASRLEEFGLVEKAITKPVKYKAIPLSDGLSILMERRSNETRKLQAEIQDLTKRSKLRVKMTTPKEEEPQFVLIFGKKTDILRRREALETSEASLDVITLFKRHMFVEHFYLELLEEALQRGVKMRIIVCTSEDVPTPENMESIKNSLFEVRYTRISPLALVSIFDQKEMFMPILTKSGYGEVPVLWSKTPSLLAIAQNYFETMWLKVLEEIPE